LKSKADYTTNIFDRKFPRGLDVEVISAKALFESEKKAKKKGTLRFPFSLRA
jgi:spore coat polysaccharide biosynthesis protein SpsF (cytidylyltransferase family)